MALSADSAPHFTTIADFISTMGEEITALFREVLMICDELELIGREMFASDGCKLPSNASKEWSGTKGREDRGDGVGRPLYSQEATGRKRTKPALPTASKRATAARDFCIGVSAGPPRGRIPSVASRSFRPEPLYVERQLSVVRDR
jgi:hypothetical protein